MKKIKGSRRKEISLLLIDTTKYVKKKINDTYPAVDDVVIIVAIKRNNTTIMLL